MSHGLPYGILCTVFFVFVVVAGAPRASAWDGFDSNSGALVEVQPESVPAKGDTITVNVYQLDESRVCLVDDVRRNLLTLELVVRCSDAENVLRTLVMDRI